MESNMVNPNTEVSLSPQEAVSAVKSYFERNFSDLILIEENIMMGYWVLKFKKENRIIFFDGDIAGVFNTYLLINEKQIPLWDLDKNLFVSPKTNIKNLMHILESLKRIVT